MTTRILWGGSIAAALLLLGLAAAQAPGGEPAHSPAALRAELRALLDRVERTDPRGPAATVRLKEQLEELTRLTLRLAEEQAMGSQPAPAAIPQRVPGRAPALLQGPLFAKRDLEKYHRPGCHAGERIAVGERRWFPTPAVARANGLQPCGLCHPDQWWARQPVRRLRR